MFERETKREKILESRQRELRLKERTQSQAGPRPEEEQRNGNGCAKFSRIDCYPRQLTIRQQKLLVQILECSV